MRILETLIMERFKHLNLSPKLLISIISVSAAIAISSFYLVGHQQAHSQQLTQAYQGNNVCFQRITQTFTALMVQDIGSQFLADSFKSGTEDCYRDLSQALSASSMDTTVMGMINNLESDFHWFNQKMSRVIAMVNKGEGDIYQSNITDKYADIEGLKDDIASEISTALSQSNTLANLGLGLMGLSLLGIFCAVAISILRQLNSNLGLKQIEKSINSDSQIDIIHDKVFSILELPNINSFYHEKLSQLKNRAEELEDQLVLMNTMGQEETYYIEPPKDAPVREVTAFGEVMSQVLDRVHEKAFETGTILDTDLQNDFQIFAFREPLEQLMFSLFQYAMEAGHSEGQKIVVRSKALGGIAYCKLRISNFSLSDQEMAYLNGSHEVIVENTNLMLLRELLEDAQVKLAVKNKSQGNQAESEFELIFDRYQEPKNVNVNVMKGNKQEIKAFLESQL